MTNDASVKSQETVPSRYTLQRLGWFGGWFFVTMWVNSLWMGKVHGMTARLVATFVFITTSYAIFQYVIGRFSSLPAESRAQTPSRVPVTRLFAHAFASGRRQREQSR